MNELTTRQINALKKKNIENEYQLKRWFPIRYIDNTEETGIIHPTAENPKPHVVIIGKISNVTSRQMRSGLYFIQCLLADRKTGKKLKVMFFNLHGGHYLDMLVREYTTWTDKEAVVAGNIIWNEEYGYSIANPVNFGIDLAAQMRVFPVYRKISGISDKNVNSIINDSFELLEEDTVPEDIRKEFSLMGINGALECIMKPDSLDYLKAAERRLLFDDLFYFAGQLTLKQRLSSSQGLRADKSTLTQNVISQLPFALTDDQAKAFESIREKMICGKHFNALVQGDVGAGKTIVGFLPMILAAENGYQAAMLAPTKILAIQHYEKLTNLLAGTNIKVQLVTNSTLNKTSLASIEDGSSSILIGTHSLLSNKIKYKNLSLVIIDEEHKFGVSQRNKLTELEQGIDSISMSATPIPRTLASAIYGSDTEIISIKQKPGGRKPVKTLYDDGSKLQKYISQILELGQQVYAVCPMISEADEDSVMAEVKSTHQAVEEYRKMFPVYKIEELTGETAPEESERILSEFKNGTINMLVSTTVVEVGVDVPNATLIIIHNAERFGLAGLHQLRGRVGRGDKQSFCVLVSNQPPEENERLKTLIDTNDGFEIAEKDLLDLRRSGNLFGEEQSGRNVYMDEVLLNSELYKNIMEIMPKIDTYILKNHIEKMLLCENSKRKKVFVDKNGL